ncbi:alpha-glucan family phosphorylase [Gryllotalpicola protaetiae]|uniref:glycogen phosphorylase n=1 Tax=Gryllotalpicola protaetiae TaxID=2419771 RepID=A0A387BIX5_9MICO|nr:alpha-glucan family phosphorylase [Gryllotalpicola protaetiae]AYG02114.1 alpha-glucan family phosphorylase [Gryllotalpicola protaetiae]
MKAIRRFTVRAVIPEALAALDELALNLRWSWHRPTQRLFRSISEEAWHASHDPIQLLGAVEPARLEELAADPAFVQQANDLRDDLRRYLSEPRWYQGLVDAPQSIAYFSAEFGVAAALPQYSGGLGILAGDHLKAASDLGVPLIGIGLFYRSGYFRQSISGDGWQQEAYPVLDPDGLPLSVLRRPDGMAARVSLGLPDGRALAARVWVAEVGRVKLLLLDTNIRDNDEELRSVTDRLYGGGGEHRLLQELLLGIGGVRAIALAVELLGVAQPTVFHTNEGHSGFQGLERISNLIGEGLSFDEALQVVRAGTVFTTHTPVPAGIDRFERPLIERYFATPDLLPGVTLDQVLGLALESQMGGPDSVFNMAVLGLRLGQHANGVAKLHGRVSRAMFQPLWPGFDADEVPITSVTNGVHAPTWVDSSLIALAEAHFGTGDTTRVDWESDQVTDAGLWAARNEMRASTVADARRRVRAAHEAAGGVAPAWTDEVLDANTLTIGFARRGASYKRLTLMLHDKERLAKILLDPERPVQIVVAGKAHPADDEGKRLIQELYEFAEQPEIREHLVFLPNYDITMAQTLYPGTDVWLNNPLRPMEACGTSGMKAALNGSLNLSILDGWWDEYYDGKNGWAIPSADSAGDSDERDALEAAALYDLIEHQLAPMFYERSEDGIPVAWLGRVRYDLKTLSPELSADRMVMQYVQELYAPAHHFAAKLDAHGFAAARALSAWKRKVVAAWPQVAVAHVESGGLDAVPQVGEELHLRAHVALGALAPADVRVEVVYGRSESAAGDELTELRSQELELEGGAPAKGGAATTAFGGIVVLDRAGSFGYTVRVLPKNELLASAAELGLVASAG